MPTHKQIQNLIVILALVTVVQGFHDLPHMLVLGVAKQVLIEKDPEIMQVAEKYFDQFEEPDKKGQITFEEHSLWADDIKGVYKSGVKYWETWHYTDQVYNPSNYPINQNDKNEQNAQTAFNQIRETFKDKNLKGKITVMKHIFLKHLVHLVGDIHQPLHTISFFSEKFLKGDLGGNKQYIQLSDQKKSNLHFYFDSGAFYYNFKERIQRPLNTSFIEYFENEVERLMKKYTRNQLQIKDEDMLFDEWIKESYQISVENIYSQINLLDKQNVNLISDENHLKNQELCQKQIAKAGYRLANVLIEFLKNEKGIFTFDKVYQIQKPKQNDSNTLKVIILLISVISFGAFLYFLHKNQQKLKQNGDHFIVGDNRHQQQESNNNQLL